MLVLNRDIVQTIDEISADQDRLVITMLLAYEALRKDPNHTDLAIALADTLRKSPCISETL